ncbi:hypothetical protein DICVIV_13712 [Dictyocaulus viviparus]|uniref:Uncharacterized protein n=1 Tax=Dictyocaulus viviparus TaxID=29172 RepID=A0A0D8XD44_DICVI|nr:hypothetical protein DICVIV_13712 [Dictyocaulus viviparus]
MMTMSQLMNHDLVTLSGTFRQPRHLTTVICNTRSIGCWSNTSRAYEQNWNFFDTTVSEMV